jgi:hypothetical protein
MSDQIELTPEERASAIALIRTLYRINSAMASSARLVERARELDAVYMRSRAGSPARAALAGILLDIAAFLDARIAAAPLDARTLLPAVDGLRWNSSSPLAGILEDIPPFGHRDQWMTDAPSRHRPPRQRRRGGVITFDDHLVTGQGQGVTGGGRRPGPIGTEDIVSSFEPPPQSGFSTAGQVGDVAGFLSEGGTLAAESILGISTGFGIAIFSLGVGVLLQVAGYIGGIQDAEARAAFNARLRGFSEALEALSNQFSAIDLTADPSEWPMIRTPRLSPPSDMTGRTGPENYRLGVSDAVTWIANEDRRNGNRRGVLFLYWLHTRSGWRGAHGIRQQILQRAGYAEWSRGYLAGI